MITNLQSLPQPIVDAISNDDYDAGDAYITASSLWQPPRIRQLRKKHKGEIHADAADGIFALIGKSVHSILEKAGTGDAMQEVRLSMEILGKKLGGKFDRFVLTNGALQDWKVTSVYSVIKGDKPEWVGQMNTYAHLLRHHNIEVKKLEIVGILRDWSKREARKTSDYPQKQVVTLPLPLWTPEEAQLKIEERMKIHLDSEVQLPLCSPDERWLKPPKWAATKAGAKRAVKLFNERDAAEAWISSQKDSRSLFVEERLAEPIRCLDYCDVGAAGLCEQWNKDPLNLKEQLKDFI